MPKGNREGAPMSNTKVPEFLDEVKNVNSGVVGTVLAIYKTGADTFLDVRIAQRMYYGSLIANWEVVIPNDELEGL